MKEQIIQTLKTFHNLSEVPDDQLGWLIDQSKVFVYQPGEHIRTPGDPVLEMMILLEGEIRIDLKQGNRFHNMGTFSTGEITGKLPFSRMQTTISYLTVTKKTTILMTPEAVFPEIAKRYELIQALVHSMSDRIRHFTSLQQQNEKLVALGKLSAGLAHELNNPASAMVRGATELRKNLRAKPEKFKAVMNIRLTNEQVDAVNELVFRKAGKSEENNQSLMERTALEDELTDWMEDHGVEDGFEYANTFAEYCFDIDDLEYVSNYVPDEYLPAILSWIEDVLTTEKMVIEMEEAARRISDLVSSVKTYSHMDRGTDKEIVDLKKHLKSTLTMLNHKVNRKNVRININIPKDLPKFSGFVSELNQVWTNLLDNAIDAVDDEGQIEIEASSKNGDLYLYFRDNGSGIPDEVKNQIFDPFFTTKEIGQGTGLGLDVVHKIVEKHGGSIEFESKPGDTVFKLRFPLS